MAFFKVTIDQEKVKDYSGEGGKWLTKSNMYEVIIKAVIVDVTEKGSEYLNLYVEHEGQAQMLYNVMRLTNNNGDPNEVGHKLFTKLCVIAGATDNGEINDPVSRVLPVGKNKEEKECMVLEDFDETPIILRLQMEYSEYNGEKQETKIVRNFFRYEDKATAAEIVDNSEQKGVQYEKELEYAHVDSYKDGLTEEDIIEWKKQRKSGKKEGTSDNKPSAGFGQKRTFGKKTA